MKLIKTKKDYQEAMARIDQIFDAAPGTDQFNELEVLSVLIEKYEEERFPIDLPDPIEALKFRMDQLGLKQKDLADILGFKSRVSEVLNRKRKLTVHMIRKINERLSIPAEVLVQDYFRSLNNRFL